MKYAIWRHEDSLGNSAEHTIGLHKHLLRTNDEQPIIYVEHEFQKQFVLCIPGVTEENIKFFDRDECDLLNVADDLFTKDIYMPNAYRNEMSYPAVWKNLADAPDTTLEFKFKDYENKYNLPQNAIVIQLREKGTFWKRHVGAEEEPERFVNPETFFRIAEHYANKGYKIVRIGDRNQTPFPKHENIIDFALEEERTIEDDLFLIATSKLFISCDSGIWPMAAGMKKNLLLCNVTSIYNPLRATIEDGVPKFKLQKIAIIDWLPAKTTAILAKKAVIVESSAGQISLGLRDNTYEEIASAAKRFLE